MVDVRKLYKRDRATSPTTRASPRPAVASPRSPSSTATSASCCTAATRSRTWPSTATSWRSATCCSTANCRPPSRNRRFRAGHHLPHHAARADELLLSAASAVTPTRWRSWSAWSAPCRPSITTAPTSTIPRQRMVASHRLIAKMPTIAAMAYKYLHRPALRLSAQRSGLCRELPQHDVSRCPARSTRSARSWRRPWTGS